MASMVVVELDFPAKDYRNSAGEIKSWECAAGGQVFYAAWSTCDLNEDRTAVKIPSWLYKKIFKQQAA